MPHNSATALEVTNDVLNHQAANSPNPVLYQNTIVGIQNFANHTQCVEWVYHYFTKSFILVSIIETYVLSRDDQNDELIAVITTVPISQPYIPLAMSEESENS